MSNEESLSREDRERLLKEARATIESYSSSGKKRAPAEADEPISESLRNKRGAFVSLHKHGSLRGCIGTFEGEGSLLETVRRMAVSAGWQDPRFRGLDAGEIKDIDIEISVLTPMRKIEDVNEIEVGRHGIYITSGFNRGVLLPQVATEYGWDRKTFLEHTCMKAGLPPDAWKRKDTTIEIFSAEVFSEKDMK